MTMSTQIIEVLNDLCGKFGLAIDWSQENIIPYLQELASKYISWEIATSWMYIILGIVLILLGLTIMILEIKNKIDLDGFGYFIFVGTLIGFGVLICIEALDILTCKYFPEKQIIEYIQTLMTK